MDLFLTESCPNCEALKARVNLEGVEGLTVHFLPRSGLPRSEEEADALALADAHDVLAAPTLLLPGGKKVLDVFSMLDILRAGPEASAGKES